MATKLETGYEKIKAQVQSIVDTHGYANESAAFGHFIVKNLFNIDDQLAIEAITDGGGDNGIDALYIDRTEEPVVLHFLQFKFPNSIDTIDKGYEDKEISLLTTGTLEFLKEQKLNENNWNKELIDKSLEVRELEGYTIKLWNIRYTSVNSSRIKEKLQVFSQKIEYAVLNECTSEVWGAREIMELYAEKVERKFPDLQIEATPSAQIGRFQHENYITYNAVTSVKELYCAVKDYRERLFESNVRYYNSRTEVTKGIRRTLTTEPENFFLLNNGITIVAKKVNINLTRLNLKSSSIINGAQTVGSILEVLDNATSIDEFSESYILLRIIEIAKDEQGLLNKTVGTLNTQTKMFNAFSISNDDRLKKLQEEVEKNTLIPYFLELKYNEFDTLKQQGHIDKYKKNLVDAEKLIQIYTAYNYAPSKAYLAKLRVSELFEDDKHINSVLNKLTIVRFKEIVDIYWEIKEVIKKFRQYRNGTNDEILNYLGIEESAIDEYQFLTTSDILILFTMGTLVKKTNRKATMT